eukprot:517470_1
MGTCVSGCNGSTDGHEDKEAQNRSKYKSQHDAKHICEEALSGSSERIPLHTNLNKLDLSSASNPDDATVTNDDRKATDSSMEDQESCDVLGFLCEYIESYNMGQFYNVGQNY